MCIRREKFNPKYKFENFVVKDNNEAAYSAALAVAHNPGERYSPLFIYGGFGLGKTHLMHSIGHAILERDSKTSILYLTGEEIVNEVSTTFQEGDTASISKLREKYRTVDVFMVDDVQDLIEKDNVREEFFYTFNVLFGARKQIVLSSDKPPKEMETLDERFRSRFEWGLVVGIDDIS